MKQTMKLTRWIVVALLLSVLAACATKQERAERLAQTRMGIMEALAKRQLRIEVRSMNTMRYGSRIVTPDFFLELRGDTLRSYLPYLGVAHQAPMVSPSEGLNFETVMKSYHQSKPKPDLARLEIEAKTKEDFFVYHIEVYYTGKAFISVQSQHRDPISFDGEVIEKER
jgi:hypothetical protein